MALAKTMVQRTNILSMHRQTGALFQRGRRLSTGKGKKRIWTRHDVETAAAERRRYEEAVQQARWVSSWMTPWERAQMDAPTRPLRPWERVYWQLFVVLGGVGFAYETWVLGNRRVLIGDRDVARNPAYHDPGQTVARGQILPSDYARTPNDVMSDQYQKNDIFTESGFQNASSEETKRS